MDLYIYYQVPCQQAQHLQARVAAMQAALTVRTGVVTELKRRPENKEGRHTWMEVYHDIPDEFDAILAQAVIQAQLASLIQGARHTEYFLDVSSCA